MYQWENIQSFKVYLKSREKTAINLFGRFTHFLKNETNSQKLEENRMRSLDMLMIKLNCVPKEISEITFNLYHISYLIEKELKRQVEKEEEDLNIKVLVDNYHDYFLFTSLFISAKFCGNSNFFKKVKELIIDSNLNFNTIILCEILFLNYTDWNLPLFSPSEMIYAIFAFLKIPQDTINELEMTGVLDNYINYSFSEILIYTSFDQFIVSLAICKLLLGEGDNYFITNFEALLKSICDDTSKVNSCKDLICTLLNTPDEDEELIEEISTRENSPNSPFVF